MILSDKILANGKLSNCISIRKPEKTLKEIKCLNCNE